MKDYHGAADKNGKVHGDFKLIAKDPECELGPEIHPIDIGEHSMSFIAMRAGKPVRVIIEDIEDEEP